MGRAVRRPPAGDLGLAERAAGLPGPLRCIAEPGGAAAGRGCRRGVLLMEWRVASAEQQFGHAAPIAAGVAGVNAARHYRTHMLGLLARLATDADKGVAGAAVDAVLEAVPQWLGRHLEAEVLSTVASLPRDADARVH